MSKPRVIKVELFKEGNQHGATVYVPIENIASFELTSEGHYCTVHFRPECKFGVNFHIHSVNCKIAKSSLEIIE